MKRKKAAKPAKRTAKRPGGSLEWVKRGRTPSVTILIADSEKSSRAEATRAIQSLRGMRVVGEAGTGIEAVSMTGRLKPRVVLLDLNLSSEFGASLISVLRRKSARPVILLRRVSRGLIEALSTAPSAAFEEEHGAVPTGCLKLSPRRSLIRGS